MYYLIYCLRDQSLFAIDGPYDIETAADVAFAMQRSYPALTVYGYDMAEVSS